MPCFELGFLHIGKTKKKKQSKAKHQGVIVMDILALTSILSHGLCEKVFL